MAKQEQHNKDDLEGLSQEELAALNDDDDDDDDDDEEELDDAAAKELAEKAAADAEAAAKKAAEEHAGDAGEKDKDQGGGSGDDAAEKPAVSTAKPPQYPIDETALKAAKTALGAIDGELAGLAKQFEDGDIDEAAYAKQQREIYKRENAAQRVVDRVEILNEINQTNQENDVQSALKRFLAMPENKIFDDRLTFPMYQEAFNIVYANKDFAGASFDDILAEAGRMAKAKMGHPDADVDTDDGKKKIGAKERINARRAAKAAAEEVANRTLADKTAAASEGGEEYTGKFAHLNGLTAHALESALAKLSESDALEWLQRD